MGNFFDDLTSSNAHDSPDGPKAELTSNNAHVQNQIPSNYFSQVVKTACQELLKYGLLDAEKKPNLYQTALTHRAEIHQILEPLDLSTRVDDVRGLIILIVASDAFSAESDEWSHPLVRRQRLTLEQSLLIAILRQHYIVHEQESGIGANNATVALDELLPQIMLFLPQSGSETKDEKRLRNLLDHLKGHGIVSEINEKDQVTIRPLITHLANPNSLVALLEHFKTLAESKL